MKVRFGYTIDVSDAQRRAIAAYNDNDPAARRLASHTEIGNFFSALGHDNGLGVLAEHGLTDDTEGDPK